LHLLQATSSLLMTAMKPAHARCHVPAVPPSAVAILAQTALEQVAAADSVTTASPASDCSLQQLQSRKQVQLPAAGADPASAAAAAAAPQPSEGGADSVLLLPAPTALVLVLIARYLHRLGQHLQQKGSDPASDAEAGAWLLTAPAAAAASGVETSADCRQKAAGLSPLQHLHQLLDTVCQLLEVPGHSDCTAVSSSGASHSSSPSSQGGGHSGAQTASSNDSDSPAGQPPIEAPSSAGSQAPPDCSEHAAWPTQPVVGPLVALRAHAQLGAAWSATGRDMRALYQLLDTPQQQQSSSGVASAAASVLLKLGAGLCAALPSRFGCNNPICSNVGGVSEGFSLVRGQACICSGCLSLGPQPRMLGGLQWPSLTDQLTAAR
jgi:hypothetical protein